MNEIKIIYKDRCLAVAVKPVGMLSEGDGDVTVGQAVSQQTGGGFAEPVNRLDRVCGGLILVSRDRRYTGKLSELVASGKYGKKYLAVLEGKPETDAGILEDLLFHDMRSGKTYTVDRERKGAKHAVLDYRTVAVAETEKGIRTLVSVTLHTGRTHQIRAQFSSRGLPLCGDGKYGGRDNSCTCALWSYGADFTHPVTGRELSLRESPPDIYPWNLFGDVYNKI